MFCMDAQHWIEANPSAPFFLFPISLCATFFVLSKIGGWAALTQRFRATEPFYGESWGWQSAKFRGWCNYNNCLTVGVSQEALYLSVMIPFRLFHPPLLIPWREIEVETGKALFGFYDTAQFRIGTEERVRVRIYGKLVNRVREAAGQGWPLYDLQQMEFKCEGGSGGCGKA
jgi:hypothetical protein